MGDAVEGRCDFCHFIATPDELRPGSRFGVLWCRDEAACLRRWQQSYGRLDGRVYSGVGEQIPYAVETGVGAPDSETGGDACAGSDAMPSSGL